MTTAPYTYNSLFRPGPNSGLNACVGTNGGPYDFGSYAEGFFEAGFKIVDAIRRGEWTIDILVYPAVFDFRHGIELYIKHMTILANRLLATGQKMELGHGILKNWAALTQLFSDLKNPHFDALEIDIVKDVLTDFVEIDATGQVFRYPEDNRGQPHLRDISVINVEVLAEGMRHLYDLFETWDSGLIALLEASISHPAQFDVIRPIFLAMIRESLETIREPRLFETERGYQGELLAMLRPRLMQAGFPGDPIIEQEYQKRAKNHGIDIRPDLIIHIPFNRGATGRRREGNFVAIEIKRGSKDIEHAFESLRKIHEALDYSLAIFINIDSEETHAEQCPASLVEQTVCFAVMLKDGAPIVRMQPSAGPCR